MKKIIAMISAIIMALGSSSLVFADGMITKNENAKCSIVINETVDELHRTIRNYKADENTFVDGAEEANPEEILLALGMDEEEIGRLSEEALLSCGSAKEIYYITAYTKTDESGVVSYLTEKQAVEEAAELRMKQDVARANQIKSLKLNVQNSINQQGSYSDEYMVINLLVTNNGGGNYRFMVSGVGLTMPYWRKTDSIGASAQVISINNDSRYGHYWYGRTINNNGTITTDSVHVYNGITYGNAATGNWYGSACSFSMPNDYFTDTYSIWYDDLGAYYEFTGSLIHPTLPTTFSVVGNYNHIRASISYSPSITITTGPFAVSISVGVYINNSTDVRGAEFQVTYTP